jgi:hypothetical protein
MTLDHLFDAAAKPKTEPVEGDDVVIFRGGETLPWSIGEIKP